MTYKTKLYSKCQWNFLVIISEWRKKIINSQQSTVFLLQSHSDAICQSVNVSFNILECIFFRTIQISIYDLRSLETWCVDGTSFLDAVILDRKLWSGSFYTNTPFLSAVQWSNQLKSESVKESHRSSHLSAKQPVSHSVMISQSERPISQSISWWVSWTVRISDSQSVTQWFQP